MWLKQQSANFGGGVANSVFLFLFFVQISVQHLRKREVNEMFINQIEILSVLIIKKNYKDAITKVVQISKETTPKTLTRKALKMS